LHILDLENFKWLDFQAKGNPPGPCNMHTADAYNNKVYVFRGGDGKDYLNDLHELDCAKLQWTKVTSTGCCPPPRANHSSSIIKSNLYIFGGWDGSKRLNDLYMLNLDQMFWTQVIVEGESPAPRAGMSLCNVENKLFLFGGSGPHAYCFNDLYVFDPEANKWTQYENFSNPESKPKARAGHSKTLVDSRLFIIGGSYGQDYLKDVYILDTDPCPLFAFQNTS
jgi:leucine-zipper-like transcriptional regulator 1